MAKVSRKPSHQGTACWYTVKLMSLWMTTVKPWRSGEGLSYFLYASAMVIGHCSPYPLRVICWSWRNCYTAAVSLCFTKCSKVFLRFKKLGAHWHKSQLMLVYQLESSTLSNTHDKSSSTRFRYKVCTLRSGSRQMYSSCEQNATIAQYGHRTMENEVRQLRLAQCMLTPCVH